MLWLVPRSYLKWVGAVAVVAFSWWIRLMPDPTSLHPFAVGDLPMGTEISEHLFEFREIPAGLLPPIAIGGTLSVEMTARGPFCSPPCCPRIKPWFQKVGGPWPLAAPLELLPGSQVMLVMGEDQLSPGAAVPGMVIRSRLEGSYGEEAALIAVPEEHLSRVAAASAYGGLTVAVAPNR